MALRKMEITVNFKGALLEAMQSIVVDGAKASKRNGSKENSRKKEKASFLIDCISAGKNLFFTFAIASTDTHRERERDEGNPLLVVTRWRSVGGVRRKKILSFKMRRRKNKTTTTR